MTAGLPGTYQRTGHGMSRGMKLPRLTAEYGLGPSTTAYRAGRAAAAAGGAAVRPQTSIACLTGCVGPSAAAECSARCGADMTCWQDCADIRDTSCVAACYRT